MSDFSQTTTTTIKNMQHFNGKNLRRNETKHNPSQKKILTHTIETIK